MTQQPTDQAARDRIEQNLDRTLFVEAGAGSGKTRALVNRVLALIASGVPMEKIAVITFTEKAGAELRSRIRQRLENSLQAAKGTDVSNTPDLTLDAANSALPPAAQMPMSTPLQDLTPATANAALLQLDSAAVGTLHSFAKSILIEHPIEAGLPPDVQVLDEIQSEIDFEAHWLTFVDRLLDDVTMSVPLLTMEAFHVDIRSLRKLVLKMNANWDKLQAPPSRISAFQCAIDLDPLLENLKQLKDLGKSCREPDDRLLEVIETITQHGERIRSVVGYDDHVLTIRAVENLKKACKAGRKGRKQNWGDDLQKARDAVEHLEQMCDHSLVKTAEEALKCLLIPLTRFVLDLAEHRRRNGRLEFHDLLVRACQLLRDQTHGLTIRTALRDRYRYLLLDEFQDTDPIQIEIAMLLACRPDTDMSPTCATWNELECEQGRLFFVGDPKQSIYRFRRADIATYLRTQSFVNDSPSGSLEILTTNFRCAEPIVDWVNTVFEKLIQPVENSQPEYIPLRTWRPAAPTGPGVTILGSKPLEPPPPDPPPSEPLPPNPQDPQGNGTTTLPGADTTAVATKLNAAALRAHEAEAVAETVMNILAQKWDVRSEDGETWRPAQRSDIAILIPDRNSLNALEDSLVNADIPFRVEASSLVYGTREVRDLLNVLQALADPTDELALVTALRSPLYGCGDDDLAHWKFGFGGRFSLISRLPDNAPENHPVTEALRHLRRFSDAKRWDNPARLLDRLIRERGVYEMAVLSRRPRDVWHRLRFLCAQAQAWADAGGTNLREYLQWARLQGEEHSRAPETVLPETDGDYVRILTVHGSKGLEFPIAVISGMTSYIRRSQRGPDVLFPDNRTPEVYIKKGIATRNYESHRKPEQEMDCHERLRLLYVACTRAKDHLVVSLCRKASKKTELIASSEKPETFPESINLRTTYAEVLAMSDAVSSAVSDAESSGNSLTNYPEEYASEYPETSESCPETSESCLETSESQHEPPDREERQKTEGHLISAGGPGSEQETPSQEEWQKEQQQREEWQKELASCLQHARIPTVISPTQLTRMGLRNDVPASTGFSWNERSSTTAAGTESGDEAEKWGGVHHEQNNKTTSGGDGEHDTEERGGTGGTWSNKTYSGTAIGTAVHKVLQTIDIATGKDLEIEAQRQAIAEGIKNQTASVAQLARSALNTETAERAAQTQHWREMYVAAKVAEDCDIVVEGYIDLMYRSRKGLVLVDWKTDLSGNATKTPSKLARYQLQGAAYAAAVEAATGKTVARVELVFLQKTREPIIIPIENLRSAIQEVQQLIRSLETPI